jgi:hypothetical protein
LRSLNLVFMLPSFLLALVSLRRNNSPFTASAALAPAHTHSVAGGATLPQFQCSRLFLYQIQTLFRSSPPHLEHTRFFLLQHIRFCYVFYVFVLLARAKVELLDVLYHSALFLIHGATIIHACCASQNYAPWPLANGREISRKAVPRSSALFHPPTWRS